jgi:hypothetical protein
VGDNEIIGLLVDGVPFYYRISLSDTPDSIAANLAAIVSAARPATLSGTTLTIPEAASLKARVVTDATVSRELRRQRRDVQISCWCPTTTLRDLVCNTIDMAMVSASFIALSDGTKARTRYLSTEVYDQSQNALLYRRDLRYSCEYATIARTTVPVMLFGELMTGRGNQVI